MLLKKFILNIPNSEFTKATPLLIKLKLPLSLSLFPSIIRSMEGLPHHNTGILLLLQCCVHGSINVLLCSHWAVRTVHNSSPGNHTVKLLKSRELY